MTDVIAYPGRHALAHVRERHIRTWVCKHKLVLLASIGAMTIVFGCWVVLGAALLALVLEART